MVQRAIELFTSYPYESEPFHIRTASFKTYTPRGWQKQPTDDLIQGRNVIVQMPVGEGKSIVFHNAIAYNKNTSYIVMPTIALSVDMHRKFTAQGAKTMLWSSITPLKEKKRFWEEDDWDAIILAPEAIDNVPIKKGGLFIVDEAHNIITSSMFREHYSRLYELTYKTKPSAVGLFSATLDDDMVHTLKKKFFAAGAFKDYRRKNPDRANIKYAVRHDFTTSAIVNLISNIEGSAIVYAYSKKDVDLIASILKPRLKGFKVMAYHSQVKGKKERLHIFQTQKSVVVATTAFGEGIDKSDVEVIIRRDLPMSMIQLVQEAGRLQRNGKKDGTYYLFPSPDSKKAFEHRKIRPADVLRVLDNMSYEIFKPYTFDNYFVESNVINYLVKYKHVAIRKEVNPVYKIEFTGKNFSKRPYARFLRQIKGQRLTAQEMDDIDPDFRQHLKNAKAAKYLTYEAPATRVLYKALSVPNEIHKFNEAIDKEYQSIMGFIKAPDKKKYIEEYFNETL